MLEVEDVRFAYDAEFFYVGIRERFTENDANRSIERRVRDTEMNDVARVVLELDLDHDLMTRYKLTVDQRGRTRDTCDGFTAWQPRWYVATDVNDGVRTVEAAIRREALTQLPPVRGERWRIRASLLRPGEISPKGGLPDPTGWRDLIFE